MTINDQLEQSKIEVLSDLMNSIDLARQSMDHLNESIIYLDYTNPYMIQSYFDSIQDIQQGLHYFKEAFWHNAKAYGIDLNKTISEL